MDACAENIAAAKVHATGTASVVDYQCTTAEDLVTLGQKYDVVVASDVLEHVMDQPGFISSCAALVRVREGVCVAPFAVCDLSLACARSILAATSSRRVLRSLLMPVLRSRPMNPRCPAACAPACAAWWCVCVHHADEHASVCAAGRGRR